MVELANAVDEALLGLGDGVDRVERTQCTDFQRLRNFACVCPPQRSKLLLAVLGTNDGLAPCRD